jgi:hypothetical protein
MLYRYRVQNPDGNEVGEAHDPVLLQAISDRRMISVRRSCRNL